MSILDACTQGDTDAVRTALAEDPSAVQQRDEVLGSTPLILAAHRGFLEIVQLLLESGAPVDEREEASQTTALHWAAEGGHPAIIELLIGAGADPNPRDEWFNLGPIGWATIIRWAPQFHEDRDAAVQSLLERGSLMDPFSAIVRDDEEALYALAEQVDERLGFARQGQTPLHFAVARGNVKAVRRLLDLNADFNALTWWGVSPLALALQAGHNSIAELLQAHGAEFDLSAALFSGEFEKAKEIPFDPEMHAFLLHACTADGMDEAVDLLLELGADPGVQTPMLIAETSTNCTPLHIAALEGHIGIATELLGYGADPNALAEGTNQTPLHCAASTGQAEMVELLLGYGADPTVRDFQYDSTPAGWAEFAGHMDVAELLTKQAPE